MELHSQRAREWERIMLFVTIIAVLFIFGLFLSMLSSSPKPDAEWHIDTEA